MRRTATVFALLIGLATSLHSAVITLTGALSGANENPPTTSSGTGTATVTLDTTVHMLMLNIVFSGLTSNDSAAHIHCCVLPPGNAGVATTMPAFVGFPLGVTSGTYNQTLNLLDPVNYNPAFITANGGTVASADSVLENGLMTDMTYLNIHTLTSPGGEIRAFLVPVPEPATGAIAVSALGLLLLRRRRS